MSNTTANEWLDRHNVTFDWSSHGFQIENGWEHQVFRITLEREGRKVELPYLAGLLLVEGDPTPDDVLPLYARDIQDAGSWQDYCDALDLDPMEAPVREYNSWERLVAVRRELYDFCHSHAMFEDFESIREADEQE